jgi:hypothetical protein
MTLGGTYLGAAPAAPGVQPRIWQFYQSFAVTAGSTATRVVNPKLPRIAAAASVVTSTQGSGFLKFFLVTAGSVITSRRSTGMIRLAIGPSAIAFRRQIKLIQSVTSIGAIVRVKSIAKTAYSVIAGSVITRILGSNKARSVSSGSIATRILKSGLPRIVTAGSSSLSRRTTNMARRIVTTGIVSMSKGAGGISGYGVTVVAGSSVSSIRNVATRFGPVIAGSAVTRLLTSGIRRTAVAGSAITRVRSIVRKFTAVTPLTALKRLQIAIKRIVTKAAWTALVLSMRPAIFLRLGDSGVTAVDLSGNGRDGTYVNAPSHVAGAIAGDSDQGVALDGSTQYVQTSWGTRRNLCTNPIGRYNSADWANVGSSGLVVRTAALPTLAGLPVGITTGFEITSTGGADGARVNFPVTAGVTYVLSVYARYASGSTMRLRAKDPNATVPVTVTLPTGANFARSSIVYTAITTGTASLLLDSTGAVDVHVTAVQIEQAASLGSYFDGDGYVGSGGMYIPATSIATSWDGLPDAAMSDMGARRNLAVNPRIGLNTTGWQGSGMSRDISWSQFGTASLRQTLAVANNDASIFSSTSAYFAASPGDVLAISAYYKIGSGATNTGAGNGPRLGIQWDDGSGTFNLGSDYGVASAPPAIGTTGRATKITNPAPAGTKQCRIRLISGQTVGTQTVDTLWSAIMCERANVINPYFDGNGYVDNSGNYIQSRVGSVTGWVGTPHASVSDIGATANGTVRTFLMWVKRDTQTTRDSIFGTGGPSHGFAVVIDAANENILTYLDRGLGQTVHAAAFPGEGVYALIGAEVDEPQDKIIIYVNGVSKGTQTLADKYNPAGGNLALGMTRVGIDHLGGALDDMIGFERGLSPSEHLALYQTGAGLIGSGSIARSLWNISKSFQATAVGVAIFARRRFLKRVGQVVTMAIDNAVTKTADAIQTIRAIIVAGDDVQTSADVPEPPPKEVGEVLPPVRDAEEVND